MNNFDLQFITMCDDIINNGWNDSDVSVRAKWKDGSSSHTIKQFGVCNLYDLQKEFPISTLRPLNFKGCIMEILWIWQKQSNKVSELGLKIWDSWKNGKGEIGKAYGYQLAREIDFPEGRMNQVDWLLNSLEKDPYNRRMIASLFNHDDLKDMTLYPCAWNITLNASGDTLNMALEQRSQDILTASCWNVSQYAILLIMFAKHANLKAGKLLHVIVDAHIYDKHVDVVKELIKLQPYEAPKLIVNPDIKNFYDFKVEDFQLENYKHHPQIKSFEVAI